MLQREVTLFEDTKIRATIELSGIADKTQAKKKAGNNQEEYTVTGVEDARQLNQFSLFNIDELKLPQPDSRKTSSSTHKDAIQGGSLATILQQALVSEDKDQIDWLLSQRDLAVIDKTLVQIKDSKTITSLFRVILQKYQQQNPTEIISLTLWLKQLLKLHWGTLLQSKDATSFESLLSLKHFIEAKTKHLNSILSVKGKLEMLKNCYTMQDATQKYWKIKSNLKKGKDEEALIY